MKKSLIIPGVVVVLAAAYVGATWYTGNQIQQHLPDFIEQLNNKQSRLHLQQSDYQKGFFSSTAKLTVTAIDNPDQVLFDKTITIHHGPFPWSEVKHLNLLPMAAGTEYDLNVPFADHDTELPIHVRNVIGYTGSYTSYLSADDFNSSATTEENSAQDYAWKAFTLKIDGNSKNNRFSVKGKVPYLSMPASVNGKALQVENLNINPLKFDLSNGVDDMGIDGNVDVSKLKMADAMGEVSFENAKFMVASERKDNTLTAQQAAITASKLIINNDYGLPVPLEMKGIDWKLKVGSPKLDSKLDLSANQTIIIGKQDLGQSQFSLSMDNFFFMPESRTDLDKAGPMQADYQLVWHNSKGQAEIKSHLLLNTALAKGMQFTADNVQEYQFHAAVPLNVVAYGLAQASAANKDEITDTDMKVISYNLTMLASMLPNKIYQFQTEDADGKKMGVYSDVSYNAKQPDVITANGQTYPAQEVLSSMTNMFNSLVTQSNSLD